MPLLAENGGVLLDWMRGEAQNDVDFETRYVF